MKEHEPEREVKQPADKIFEACLVSDFGDDRIPIDNQMVSVYRFDSDPGAAFIDITHKTGRRRIFIDNENVLGALEEIGCASYEIAEHTEHEIDYEVDWVSAGGSWDLMDKNCNYSLLEELESHGRIISAPEPSPGLDREYNFRSTKVRIRQKQGEDFVFNSSNTTLVYHEKFPEMDHIKIDRKTEEGVVGAYLFGEKQVMRALRLAGFDRYYRKYPTASTIKLFFQWETDHFHQSAAELLGDSDE